MRAREATSLPPMVDVPGTVGIPTQIPWAPSRRIWGLIPWPVVELTGPLIDRGSRNAGVVLHDPGHARGMLTESVPMCSVSVSFSPPVG